MSREILCNNCRYCVSGKDWCNRLNMSLTSPSDTEFVCSTFRPCDEINHPPHYTYSAIEVIDAIEAWQLNYHLGNVVKYVARCGKKGDALQDLRKAEWYLKRAIEGMEAAL